MHVLLLHHFRAEPISLGAGKLLVVHLLLLETPCVLSSKVLLSEKLGGGGGGTLGNQGAMT